jgi:hypothetical protein
VKECGDRRALEEKDKEEEEGERTEEGERGGEEGRKGWWLETQPPKKRTHVVTRGALMLFMFPYASA